MTSGPSQTTASGERSRRFAGDPHGRFWWHHLDGTDYVPAIYQVLTDDEWQLMDDWYAATLAADSIGEINVPAMSMLQGLITGGGLSRIVQLGGYYGYSGLLMGFWLRHMGQGGQLISIDVDPAATAFSQEWIDRAGLSETVLLMLSDSAAEQALVDTVATFSGRMPQLILLDSSHQYAHTLRELDLWVPAMEPQTLMLLHDTSTYACSWDQNGKGGVQKALDDWLPRRKDVSYMNLNRRVGEPDVSADLTYRDGCGLGILQKL
ncbi:class I SAM-dependent methyltransferase [Baekduia sp.]|jgi:predicted O-methyltransferase YrrM|uniref:class I SAM-dependent methyltransferase n=1 Tax=Baekduia sp. TaxID=2600305 RepID=UPI002E061A0D|nr:class I SAM-dependent methyltransferase [Baekduia sp.]